MNHAIQNGRLYQYALDRLRLKPLALLAAHGARAAVRFGLLMRAYLPGRRRALEPADVRNARRRVSAAFPKPDSRPVPAVQLPGGDVDMSIIVPVYNAGEALDACVLSIHSQARGLRYELILIDDGSGEATARRVRDWAAHENTVVLRQKNRGAAAARNNGLNHARGKYVLFVDADDLVPPLGLQSLLDAARRTGADMVQGSWAYIDGPRQIFPEAVYEGRERMALLELPGMPWGKLMKRSLFDALRFPEGFTSYVDTPVKCLALRMCQSVATIPQIVYSWRRNPTGITFTSKNTPRALQTYWIMERMQEDNRSLGLPRDALYEAVWVRQLLCVNHGRLKGLDEGLQRDVFTLSRELLARVPHTAGTLPFMLRLGRRAFERGDFGLWSALGRWYTMAA